MGIDYGIINTADDFKKAEAEDDDYELDKHSLIVAGK
jgi:hypothetical protein